METVVEVFHSYPSFLWITWCKILFIFSDQIWKTRCSVAQLDYRQPKKQYKSENRTTHVEKVTLRIFGT
ncbi:hypothetical protein AB3B21_001676 [Escherichia coli]